MTRTPDSLVRRNQLLRSLLRLFAVGLLSLAGLVGAVTVDVFSRRGPSGLWLNLVVIAGIVALAVVHLLGATTPGARGCAWARIAVVIDLVLANVMALRSAARQDWEATLLIAIIANVMGVMLLSLCASVRRDTERAEPQAGRA